jgi:hypothetical protein
MRTLICALFACVFFLSAARALAADKPSPDEELLQKYKIPTDGPGLLDYFRKRTSEGVSKEKIAALIQEMGDDSFFVREHASRQLVLIGALARPQLLRALSDPDLEIRHRAKICLRKIAESQDTHAQVTAAALRVLVRAKEAGTVKVLFDFLPAAAEGAEVEEVRQALSERAVREGKPHPVLVAGLKAKEPIKRASAAVALCRAEVREQLPAVRKLLEDTDARVRFTVAIALATAREKTGIPVLIRLLDQLEARETRLIEELLYRLAEGKAPPGPADDSETARRKYRLAWEEWWKERGKRVDTAHLEEVARSLGHTTVLMLDAGRVLELDAFNRVLWQFEGLEQPLDLQRLPKDRVLVAEYKANRVAEYNRKGERVWQKKIPRPLVAQRLANGNTFIATQDGLVEVDATGKEVFNYNRPGGERIMRARKLPNGDMALVTNLGVPRFVYLDRSGREMKSFGVEVATSGGRIDVLPSGNILIPEMHNNQITERDPNGRVVRTIRVQQPVIALSLPSGHLLVTSNTQNRAFELDRSGKEVWEYRRDTRVTRAVRP